MRDDLGGWGPKAWNLLEKRVDALRSDVNVLMGRPANAPAGSEPKLGGLGIGTWLAILATIVVPIVVAIIAVGPS
jgi:hypothetical protein